MMVVAISHVDVLMMVVAIRHINVLFTGQNVHLNSVKRTSHTTLGTLK